MMTDEHPRYYAASWDYDSPHYRPGLVLAAVLLALLAIDGGAALLIWWWFW